VFTPLKVKFFSEVVNRLFETHTEKESVKRYKSSADICFSAVSVDILFFEDTIV